MKVAELKLILNNLPDDMPIVLKSRKKQELEYLSDVSKANVFWDWDGSLIIDKILENGNSLILSTYSEKKEKE